jgi:hypothetical protein
VSLPKTVHVVVYPFQSRDEVRARTAAAVAMTGSAALAPVIAGSHAAAVAGMRQHRVKLFTIKSPKNVRPLPNDDLDRIKSDAYAQTSRQRLSRRGLKSRPSRQLFEVDTPMVTLP